MAYTAIDKHTAHFNNKTYTGNGSTNAITGVGHQPDLVWLKKRNGAAHHQRFDAVRGVTKKLYSSNTNVEATDAQSLTAFGTDGFTLGTNSYINGNSDTFVSWNWKGAGSTAANSDGDISSTVSANTTAGFSIVAYTGNGTSNSGVGHGLGVKPSAVIIKSRNTSSTDWILYTDVIDGSYDFFKLSTTDGKGDSGASGGFTTTEFHISGTDTNTNYSNKIAYCFAEKKGYSKIGMYKGNNNADGTFVYTGFKPAFVMIKHDGSSNWTINDASRDPTNVNNLRLFPNQDVAESSGSDSMDLLSNGFKLRSTDGGNNGSNDTYWYMAIGQSLVGSNNVVATAR